MGDHAGVEENLVAAIGVAKSVISNPKCIYYDSKYQ